MLSIYIQPEKQKNYARSSKNVFADPFLLSYATMSGVEDFFVRIP